MAPLRVRLALNQCPLLIFSLPQFHNPQFLLCQGKNVLCYQMFSLVYNAWDTNEGALFFSSFWGRMRHWRRFFRIGKRLEFEHQKSFADKFSQEILGSRTVLHRRPQGAPWPFWCSLINLPLPEFSSSNYIWVLVAAKTFQVLSSAPLFTRSDVCQLGSLSTPCRGDTCKKLGSTPIDPAIFYLRPCPSGWGPGIYRVWGYRTSFKVPLLSLGTNPKTT